MSKGGQIYGDWWKRDFWWWTCQSLYRYRNIMLYNWNLHNAIKQYYLREPQFSVVDLEDVERVTCWPLRKTKLCPALKRGMSAPFHTYTYTYIFSKKITHQLFRNYAHLLKISKLYIEQYKIQKQKDNIILKPPNKCHSR